MPEIMPNVAARNRRDDCIFSSHGLRTRAVSNRAGFAGSPGLATRSEFAFAMRALYRSPLL
jgi:hypothetical protein